MTLEAIRYRAGSLQILNQLLLPHQTVYDDLRSVQDAYEAIKSMKVRELHSPSRLRATVHVSPRNVCFSSTHVALLLCSSAAHIFTLVVVLSTWASGFECTCRCPQILDYPPLSLRLPFKC